MASTHTTFGRFASHHRLLARNGRQGRKPALDDTPLVLVEGDSWLAMPLYHDIADHLERSAGGVFLRQGRHGDTAARMFDGRSLARIERNLKAFGFDLLLVSAGGNDLVDALEKTRGKPLFGKTHGLTTPEKAVEHVRAAGVLAGIRTHYLRLLEVAARAGVPVLGHSYDHPQRMGVPIKLSVAQLGLAALFKRRAGDWIARWIRHVLPDDPDQRAFARGLIDAFVADVLDTLPAPFHYADLRGQLAQEKDWNDELHPTQAAFARLAPLLRARARGLLPAGKQAAW
ncbi:MAG: hypothetical protein U0S76_07150 [Pseudoxanthomonas sp.]|nr:hypothetical protein [Pseudoxanthomonas sp.]